KKASLYKLHKIDNKVAYPEKWRDYTKLAIGRDSLLENVLNAARFETARDLAKIGKPVDRGEWRMTPPTVNAYYSASLNEMVFPAGIMQLPFFSPEAPVPSNYGGLGMVMGHELTHGFDDQGRKFDGDGNLREWWSSRVAKAYEERASCVAKQYDGYIAVDDVHLNGRLTLGENIGDIGGLKMMIAALRAKREDQAPTNAGGFNDEQQWNRRLGWPVGRELSVPRVESLPGRPAGWLAHEHLHGKDSSMRLLALPVLVVAVASSASANVLWRGDYETGDLSQWAGVEGLTSRLTIVQSPVRQGKYALRTELHQGDFASSGTRNEVENSSAQYNEVEGNDKWYAWSTMFASDFPAP